MPGLDGTNSHGVMPAKAGIHGALAWTPAVAGVTNGLAFCNRQAL
jgi:hypothetical protein